MSFKAAITLLLVLNLVIVAAEPKAPAGTKQERLTLAECIRMALERNLDLSIERLEPKISASQIITAQGTFDPSMTLSTEYGETSNPSVTGINSKPNGSTKSQYHKQTLGLSQTFSPGTEIGINTRTTDTFAAGTNYNDQYSSFTGLSLTQPLLKNFGTDINLSDIRIARLNNQIAESALQTLIDQTISDVVSAFYEWVFARDSLKAREDSLKLAQQLLEDNKTRVEIGTMSPLDVSQANAEVAKRREEVFRARRTIRNRENALKVLITSEVSEWLNTTLIPEESSETHRKISSLEEAITTALRNRPDYRKAREATERSNLQLKYRENQLWPQLDLNSSYGFAGIADDPGTSFKRVSSLDDPQWFVGFSFSIPFGNQQQTGQRDVARYRKQQALLQLKKAEQQIVIEVDNTLNEVLTNKDRVESSRIAREFAEENVKAEEEKLKAGIATTYLVLQLQRDLSEAQSAELRAKADLEKSIAELYRVQGIALNLCR